MRTQRSSRIESLILSHHSRRVTGECNEEDINDDDDDDDPPSQEGSYSRLIEC